jgi:hypothetical protein
MIIFIFFNCVRLIAEEQLSHEHIQAYNAGRILASVTMRISIVMRSKICFYDD